jgi:zinc/manganese transport system substrate-binding protein
MKKFFLFVALFFASSFLNAKINIVAASMDLKSIAEFVGGDKVSVESISEGAQDLHFVEPRPSMVMKIKKADMVLKIGLDLDMWMDSLISASRNKKVMYGEVGFVDCSKGIERLEVPQGKIDGSMGDIHLYGNPHYWLDPLNGKIIAKNILDGLVRISPENKDYFKKNYDDFCKKIDEKMKIWQTQMEKLSGKSIITYHRSWSYFAKRFNIKVPIEIEPKPGIPPNPNHILKIIDTIKRENIKIILVDNFYPLKAVNKIAADTGVRVVVVPSNVGGEKEVSNYFELFDYIISKLTKE